MSIQCVGSLAVYLVQLLVQCAYVSDLFTKSVNLTSSPFIPCSEINTLQQYTRRTSMYMKLQLVFLKQFSLIGLNISKP